MNFSGALIWGFGATVVLTTILRGSQVLGLTRIDIPYLLGSMVTPDRDRAKAYGLVLHLINGWLFALLYVAAFQTAGQSGMLLGALVGAVHGTFILLVALPLLPAFHKRMASEGWGPDPTQQLEPPGNLGLNYGISTPVVTFVAHVVYGAIIGTFCNIVY
jgi:hypothetical protein